MTPLMCPVRLHLIHIFLGHCPFLGPETSLQKDSVLGMAVVSQLQTVLKAKAPPHCATNCPQSAAVAFHAGWLVSLQSWHLLFIFRNSGIWAEPFSETTWMTSLEAVSFSSLKVTFPFVLHTWSHVQCTWEVVDTQWEWHRMLPPAPWFPSFSCTLSELGTIPHASGPHSADVTCYWTFYWFF